MIERGVIENLGMMNTHVTGHDHVGGLVGQNDGTVSNSYSTGSVTGNSHVGGLVGCNAGTVIDSYSSCSVGGGHDHVGGLVGWNQHTVSNSYYNYDQVLINGRRVITIGALFNEDFDQWLANGKLLDVNERLSKEDGYYLINNVADFKQLLAFGQDGSLKFRLKNDLDLASEPNFYIPYLAGEFDGNGHEIVNLSLSLNLNHIVHVGLFGYVASGGIVSEVGVENVDIDIPVSIHVGSIVGHNHGIVSNSYSSGRVLGGWFVGGLVGQNGGTVSNSYSSGSVTGHSSASVGGLVGVNDGTVGNSYSTGSVTGGWFVGGLVGENQGSVTNSFWDTETSGQATSEGGTGKTTAEMKSINTFSGAGWNIIGVADPATGNPSYIWNILDNETYPFLSWQSVS